MEKYKITKSIRFKLLPENASAFTAKSKSLLQTVEPDAKIASLVSEGFNISTQFEKYVFTDENKRKLKTTVSVHFRWLRQYTGNKFYEWKTNDSKIEKKQKLADVPYLNDTFITFLSAWQVTLENLNNAINAPKESSTRKSNMARAIRKLGTRQLLPFAESFVNNSKEKDFDDFWKQLLAMLANFRKLLAEAEVLTLPAQSTGVEIARASFNYYTTNKKPKNYNAERKNIERQLAVKFSFQTNQKQLLSQLGLQVFIEKPLSELYSDLKKYKSEQKRSFSEAVIIDMKNEELKEKFPLFFGSNDAFDKYIELTNSIKKKSEQKNKAGKKSEEVIKLTNEIRKLKSNRGKLFFDGHSKPDEPKERFRTYLNYCKGFKEVARKHGQLKAKLKGIDKEEIDSQRLKYWGIIIEKGLQHKLALIPKESAQKVYRQLREWRDDTNGSVRIYYFDSMTYRSLHKLCFGVNHNTFLPEVKEELMNKGQWTYNEQNFGEHVFKKADNTRDEQALIAFYKKVLNTSFVKQNLTLPHNISDELLNRQFDNEQDFRIALEKCCYIRHKKIPDAQLANFLNNNNAEEFTITSFDLERLEHKKDENRKAHTRLWLNFWKQENEKGKFPLRLNPEISITWREPKKSRVEKYGEGTRLHDSHKKNRYLHPQFTLVTTFTENALAPEINYAFQDVKQKGEAIISFNKNINYTLKERCECENLWFYGIDTGKVELATLCLMHKDKNLQTFPVLEFRKDKYDYKKTGYLKDGTQKSYKTIKNLSYFLNPVLYDKTFRDGKFQKTYDELFSKKELPAIDLGMAKVICGHIVLNGDISGYENLIKLNQMRQEQREQSVSLDKINHLRNLIAANMVGVINHLYKSFPGFIVLEDNSQSWIDDERMKFEGRIERPLEWAIYRKFQNYGLIPPVSELVRIREKEKFVDTTEKQIKYKPIKQFGILVLADKKGTSLDCPFCTQKAYQNDKALLPDKSQKIFQCLHCGYHNLDNPMDLIGLDSNDKVAAFNIAKRGYEDLQKHIA